MSTMCIISSLALISATFGIIVIEQTKANEVDFDFIGFKFKAIRNNQA